MRCAPCSRDPDAMQRAVARLEISGFDRADLSLPEVMPPAERATPEQGAKPVDTEEDARQTRTLHVSGAAAAVVLAASRGGCRLGRRRGTGSRGSAARRGCRRWRRLHAQQRVERGRTDGSRAQGGKWQADPFGASAECRKARRGAVDPACGRRNGAGGAIMPTRKGRREARPEQSRTAFPASDPPARSGVVGPRRARTQRPQAVG